MQGTGHAAPLPPAGEGCLLIADISGYSEYLNRTELEHAQDVLADLTERIVEGLSPLMRIVELEGDAVFTYALTSELEASMLLDTIEQTYFRFRARVRDIANATMCDCGACRMIPSLDLKFVVHHGRFMVSEGTRGSKPMGPDVVLVHRLLKNTVASTFGLVAYALFTERCVEALDIDPDVLELAEHTERYDGIGTLRCYVEDLTRRWAAEKERRRVYVLPTEAQFEVRVEHPASVKVVWDYHTLPEKRMEWQGAERVDQAAQGGRRGVGTTTHCVHGKDVLVEEILDWRPYRYFTHRSIHPKFGPTVFTFEFLELDEDRTEVRVRAERARGALRLLWPLLKGSVTGNFQQAEERLAKVLAEQRAPVGSDRT